MVLRILLSLAAIAGICNGALAQTGAFTSGEIPVASGLNQPMGVAVDGNGNVFIADDQATTLYEEIYSPGGYTRTTVGSGFTNPQTVAVDSNGNVYVASIGTSQVFKETWNGTAFTQSVIANNATNGLLSPYGVAVDGNGNVYVTDVGNSRLLKLTPGPKGYAQTVISSTGFDTPYGVAVDAHGNVFVADFGANTVIEEAFSSNTYTQSTLFSSGANGISFPVGVAVDSDGNIYIVDDGNNRIVEETPITGGYRQSVVATGSLVGPGGVAVDSDNNLYISDTGDGDVFKLAPLIGNIGFAYMGATSTVSYTFNFATGGTIALPEVLTGGAGQLDFTDPGTGTCDTNGTAHVYSPGDTCTVTLNFSPKVPGARSGVLTMFSTSNAVIATQWLQGYGFGPMVNYLPGVTSTLVAFSDTNNSTYGVAVDGAGNVYYGATGYNSHSSAGWINQGVFKLTPSAGGYAQSQVNVPNLGIPYGLAIDAAGSLYIADYGGEQVLKETPQGSNYIQTVVASGVFPTAIAVDNQGNVYFVTFDGKLYLETLSNGTYTQGTIVTSTLKQPGAIAVDWAGDIFIADTLNDRVIVESPSNGSYTEAVVISGGAYVAQWGVAVDPRGVVYISDRDGDIYAETPSKGKYVQTVLVTGLSFNNNLAVDSGGNVYFVSGPATGSLVQKFDVADAPTLAFGSTDVGTTSSTSPKFVAIENAGNENWGVSPPKAGINPIAPAGFTIGTAKLEGCPSVAAGGATQTIAIGAQCALDISFAPTAPGNFTGNVVYALTNAANQVSLPLKIPVNGVGARATPTITWNPPAPITYPAKLGATQLTAKATVGGTTVAGTFVYAPPGGTLLGAGTHTLSVTFTPANLTNYAPATATVTLVVNKAMLTVIADSATRAYGAANPAFTYTFDGFVNNETAATATHGRPAITTTADKYYPWGDYDIDVTQGTLTAANYSFFFVPGTLFINKAPLTIIAANVSVVANKVIPKFTYTAAGFVNGETAAVLTGTPAERSTGHDGSATGTYPIDITQGTLAAENYQFAFVDGTLTITAAPVATPIFRRSELSGTQALSVSLSDATRDATIYYTTNGEKPTTASAKYTKAIEITRTETIKAIAVAKGFKPSEIAEATYTVR